MSLLSQLPGLMKQLIPGELKFTPASAEVNWTRINALVHGPGAGEEHTSVNSVVFACLMAIATAYPEPPLLVYRKKSDGKAEKLPDQPLQDLLDNPTPNGELSIDEIMFWTAWARNVDGNAYWLKVRSGNAQTGNVVQLWPISPTLMKPVTQENSGDWISYYEYHDAPNHTTPIPVKNVVHFKLGLDDRDMRKGLAPLKALVRQISTDDEADRFVASLLKNYAVPGLVVIPTGATTLSKDDADDLTERLRRKFGNDNRGNIAVMSRESKVEQFGFSPKDLDMSILHRIPEERISAVIGVPAIVAGLGAGLDRATYANFKEAREMFVESKLVPQWRADAKKLNTNLKPDFTPDKNIYLEHDLTNVRALQEDEDAKYTRLQKAVGKPWITRNEARKDTGLDLIQEWEKEDIEPPPPPTPPEPGQPADQENPPPARNNGRQTQPNQQRSLDLSRWQRKAIKALQDGKGAACEFESSVIETELHDAILAGLKRAQTEEEIKAIFEACPSFPDLALELRRANNLLARVMNNV